uniref:Uncharacterized protein n=1 Tax=Arundo donax TaxID=35708 RepID=A0A0A8XSJ3_ARUDO
MSSTVPVSKHIYSFVLECYLLAFISHRFVIDFVLLRFNHELSPSRLFILHFCSDLYDKKWHLDFVCVG